MPKGIEDYQSRTENLFFNKLQVVENKISPPGFHPLFISPDDDSEALTGNSHHEQVASSCKSGCHKGTMLTLVTVTGIPLGFPLNQISTPRTGQ
ncbi:unnamed protein product [Calypogeia fissa]